jgi:Ecdysteroid kinase-like family
MNQFVHPNAPSEVTPAWLTHVLRSAGVLSTSTVTSLEVEIIGEGRGFTGVIARLTLQYDDVESDVPATLVAKFPLAVPTVDSSYRRSLANDTDASRLMLERAVREVEFYRAVGSDLTQLPGYYFGHVDSESGRAILLFEDLSTAVPGDALAGCSVVEARSVLRSIQDVHTRWWQDEGLDSVDWLNIWAASVPQRVERYRNQAEHVIQAHHDRLQPPVIDLMRALVESYGRILEDLTKAPATLIHADLHLDNVMFKRTGDKTDAMIIDWQSPSRGYAMLDVAGFIVESLNIEDRRASECDLLREYHDGLTRFGISGYTFEQMFDDYLRGLCVRGIGQIGWLARVIGNPPAGREREFVESILEPGWIFAALLDHDVVTRLTRP